MTKKKNDTASKKVDDRTVKIQVTLDIPVDSIKNLDDARKIIEENTPFTVAKSPDCKKNWFDHPERAKKNATVYRIGY